MKRLLVFGDNHTISYQYSCPKDSFWGLTAQHLDVDEIVNYSWPNMSLISLTHIFCNEHFNYLDDYILIEIPNYKNYSFYKEKKYLTKYPMEIFSKDFTRSINEITSLGGIVNVNYKNFCINENILADRHELDLQTKALDLIFLLYSTLKYNNAKFIIFDLINYFYFDEKWPFGKNVMINLKRAPECFIFENCDQYKISNIQEFNLEINKKIFKDIMLKKIKQLDW